MFNPSRQSAWRHFLKAMSWVGSIQSESSEVYEKHVQRTRKQVLELRELASEMRAHAERLTEYSRNPTGQRAPGRKMPRFNRRREKILRAASHDRLLLARYISKQVMRLQKAAQILESNALSIASGWDLAPRQEKLDAAEFLDALLRILELFHPLIDSLERYRTRIEEIDEDKPQHETDCVILMAAIDDLRAVYNRIWFCYRNLADDLHLNPP